MPRLWFLGEALIDFVPLEAGGERGFAPRPGGSPFNAAKAAAQAGADAAFLGAVSRDLFGDLLMADLAAHGVGTAQTPRSGAPSTLAFVSVEGGEPRYAFYNALSATALMRPDAGAFRPGPGDVLALGSIALIDAPGADNVAAFARAVAGRATVALDPNARPGMTPDPEGWRARLQGVLAVAQVARLSVEDLAALAPGAGPADFARGALDGGCRLVVVTDGERGAAAFTREAVVRVPAYAVEVVDTVGAGDTLMGTLLAELDRRGCLASDGLRAPGAGALGEVLRVAVAAAALNCAASGCAPPPRAAVERFLRERGA